MHKLRAAGTPAGPTDATEDTAASSVGSSRGQPVTPETNTGEVRSAAGPSEPPQAIAAVADMRAAAAESAIQAAERAAAAAQHDAAAARAEAGELAQRLAAAEAALAEARTQAQEDVRQVGQFLGLLKL